jgi:hypothetical protein
MEHNNFPGALHEVGRRDPLPLRTRCQRCWWLGSGHWGLGHAVLHLACHYVSLTWLLLAHRNTLPYMGHRQCCPAAASYTELAYSLPRRYSTKMITLLIIKITDTIKEFGRFVNPFIRGVRGGNLGSSAAYEYVRLLRRKCSRVTMPPCTLLVTACAESQSLEAEYRSRIIQRLAAYGHLQQHWQGFRNVTQKRSTGRDA